MSNVATSIQSNEPMTSPVKSASSNSIGEAKLYLYLKYLLCLLTLVHLLPVITPYRFYLLRFTSYTYLTLSSEVSVSASIGPMDIFLVLYPLHNCFSYLIMADTANSTKRLKYFVEFICVNITVTTVCI